jgi:hypothetical protein
VLPHVNTTRLNHGGNVWPIIDDHPDAARGDALDELP